MARPIAWRATKGSRDAKIALGLISGGATDFRQKAARPNGGGEPIGMSHRYRMVARLAKGCKGPASADLFKAAMIARPCHKAWRAAKRGGAL